MDANAAPATLDSPALADEEVVARVLRGEPALFEIVMRRYNQRLFRLARAIVRADAEAEDVVQQAYVSAYASLAQYAAAASFSTWLTRIAVNEALARVRRRARLAEVELEEHDGGRAFMSNTRDPEQHASGREQARLLERAVDALPEAYRLVFMAREVQQLSVTETAACLELSEENVKVRLHRARAMLRDTLYQQVQRGVPEAFSFLGARCDRIVAAVLAALPRGTASR